MKNIPNFTKLFLTEVQEIRKDLKAVREIDIPGLKIELAVVKEKSSNTAKIITGIGGLIAVAVSAAIAWLK